jgi:hypothetical protein
LYRRLGGTLGLVGTGAENLAPTGIQSPDRPAHSQSLYQLRYLALNHWEVEMGIHEWLQMQEPDVYNGGIFKLLP